MKAEYLEKIPEDKHGVMRELLSRGVALAVKRAPPGDGSMVELLSETMDGGAFGGGWDFQVMYIQDERMYDGPHVVVHAYHKSQVTSGSVCQKVVYSAGDRMELAKARLTRMEDERRRLEDAIAAQRHAIQKEDV